MDAVVHVSRFNRVSAFLAFAAVWLGFVYLQMSAACEGFLDFLLLMLGAVVLVVTAVVLALTRSLRLRTLVLCAVAMLLTLPASIVLPVVEYHFAEQSLKTISDALQRYQADHDVYPDRLSALTPRYLARVPSTILLFQVRQPGYSRPSPTRASLHYQLVCGPEIQLEAPETHANPR